MSQKVSVQFDPSSRYSPNLSSIQELLGNEIEFIRTNCPQFVFYGPFQISLGQRLKRFLNQFRWRGAQRIFWTGENARPDFEKFDWCVTFDYDDMVQHPRHVRRPVCPQSSELMTPRRLSSDAYLNRKFCNFLYSQPSRVRDRFFDLLSQYKRIDAPGASKNNMPALGQSQTPLSSRMSPDWTEQRLAFIKQYKFTIAFENSSYPGYVTEKMWNTLLAGSVPIYWGNPLAARDFNPKSFINVHDFTSLEHVVDWVRAVDADDDLYMAYFSEPAVARPDLLNKHWDRYRASVRKIFLGEQSG